jgi:hypothetical protein
MRQFLRRVWAALRCRQLEADLTEELECHRVMKQRELEERGLEPTAAADAARRTLDNTALARDRSRDLGVARRARHASRRSCPVPWSHQGCQSYAALQRGSWLTGWTKAERGTSENNRRARYDTHRKQLAAARAEFDRLMFALRQVLNAT